MSRLCGGGGLDDRGRSSGRGGGGLLGEFASLGNTAVAGEGDVKLGVVPLGRQEVEGESQDGDDAEIEDTVKDVAGRDTDLVATIGDTPGNRVDHPEEVEVAGKDDVCEF